jgi:hypothetical protein
MIDYSVFKMEPLPPCVQTATKLLGHGEYIVFPRTRKKLMRKIDDFGFDKYRIGLILEAGAVVGGSFILRHLMQGAKWKPNNIDIIGTRSALNTAKRILWKPDVDGMFEKIYDGLCNRIRRDVCPIVASWTARTHNAEKNNVSNNQVIDYACWTNGSGALLSFYCIKGNSVDDIHDCISQFDLPICRSFFDGRFIFVPNDTHEMLQTRRAPLTTKPVDNPNMTINTDDLQYMLEHADKYRSRGFEIKLPKTICMGNIEYHKLMRHGGLDNISRIIAKLYTVSTKEIDRYSEDYHIVEGLLYDLSWVSYTNTKRRDELNMEIKLQGPEYLRLKLIKKQIKF